MEKTMQQPKIEINEATIEPKDYFKVLKNKVEDMTADKLQDQLNTIAGFIVSAKAAGQKAFLDRLAFTYDTLFKEQNLLANGFNKFVYRDDIKYAIDKVEPKNSIKCIELEKYPRVIPIDVLEKVKQCQDGRLFDSYIVVFTDFTGDTFDIISEEEQAKINRNRDPIIFGYYAHKSSSLVHDRFYFVADWEDENCDLTFSKLIDKMAKAGVKNPEKEIGVDAKYLTEIVENTLKAMDEKKDFYESTVKQVKEEKKTFWQRIFGK